MDRRCLRCKWLLLSCWLSPTAQVSCTLSALIYQFEELGSQRYHCVGHEYLELTSYMIGACCCLEREKIGGLQLLTRQAANQSRRYESFYSLMQKACICMYVLCLMCVSLGSFSTKTSAAAIHDMSVLTAEKNGIQIHTFQVCHLFFSGLST